MVFAVLGQTRVEVGEKALVHNARTLDFVEVITLEWTEGNPWVGRGLKRPRR